MEWLTILVAMLVSRTGAMPPEDVLTTLDAARSVAFESGRPERLEVVYAPGSELLRTEQALMASYRRREVDIERMRMTVLAAKVVKSDPSRVRLEVTDQLSESRVRLADGTVRALPQDLPTKRVIELVLTADGWRIGRISLRR